MTVVPPVMPAMMMAPEMVSGVQVGAGVQAIVGLVGVRVRLGVGIIGLVGVRVRPVSVVTVIPNIPVAAVPMTMPPMAVASAAVLSLLYLSIDGSNAVLDHADRRACRGGGYRYRCRYREHCQRAQGKKRTCLVHSWTSCSKPPKPILVAALNDEVISLTCSAASSTRDCHIRRAGARMAAQHRLGRQQ